MRVFSEREAGWPDALRSDLPANALARETLVSSRALDVAGQVESPVYAILKALRPYLAHISAAECYG